MNEITIEQSADDVRLAYEANPNAAITRKVNVTET
jgi:hypothetical protein